MFQGTNRCNEIIKTSRNKAMEYYYFNNEEYYENVYKEVMEKDYKPPGKIEMIGNSIN